MRLKSDIPSKKALQALLVYFVLPVSGCVILLLTLLLGTSSAGADRGVLKPDVAEYFRIFGIALLGLAVGRFLCIKSEYQAGIAKNGK